MTTALGAFPTSTSRTIHPFNPCSVPSSFPPPRLHPSMYVTHQFSSFISSPDLLLLWLHFLSISHHFSSLPTHISFSPQLLLLLFSPSISPQLSLPQILKASLLLFSMSHAFSLLCIVHVLLSLWDCSKYSPLFFSDYVRPEEADAGRDREVAMLTIASKRTSLHH